MNKHKIGIYLEGKHLHELYLDFLPRKNELIKYIATSTIHRYEVLSVTYVYSEMDEEDDKIKINVRRF